MTFPYFDHICVRIGGLGVRGENVSLHYTFVPLLSSKRMENMEIHFSMFLFFPPRVFVAFCKVR